MKQNKDNAIHWIADEGKTFVRKSDEFDMGEEIWLGVSDHIKNYEERDAPR
ncbi:MAG: hypothetical protein IKA07_06545 [Alistipes sp.]|nr:hypothetical protein [Alistipes sp.]